LGQAVPRNDGFRFLVLGIWDLGLGIWDLEFGALGFI